MVASDLGKGKMIKLDRTLFQGSELTPLPATDFQVVTQPTVLSPVNPLMVDR